MHPGELLREDILPALDKPKAEIARLLGISRQTLYGILDEKHVQSRHLLDRIGAISIAGAGRVELLEP